ncbi:MAG: chromate transporter [Betaproteobacteria bacterium]|nr:chromate transporter [Betaproteobacteria bacterium]
MKWDILLDMAGYYSTLSLICFGGVLASMPDVHRFIVEQHHWMSSEEFTRLFGISNAAPGPNMMVVGMLGYQIAGPLGAIVSFGALSLPSSFVAYYTGSLWHRMRDRPWRMAVQAGLTPLTVGLLLASGYILTMSADSNSWPAFALTAAVVVAAMIWRAHPLWLLAGGAVLGGLGWI